MNKFAQVSNMERIKASDLQFEDEFFIYSKGSEDRSYIVFDKYIDTICPRKILMLDSRLKNELLSSQELIKYNEIKEISSNKGISSIKTISVEDSNFGVYLKEEGITNTSTVAVDISSMNFWELSGLMHFLLKIIPVQRVDILYTEPDLYHYEDNNISQYANGNSIVSVNYLKNYYSTKTTDDEILVSLIGFQKNVNKLMKDLFEISGHYSVNGFPSFYPKAKDISQVNNADFLAEIEPANRFSAEATNPFITYNTLVEINKAANGAFMNICPMCSKPMAVGACLYALCFPETTRIVYPYEETVITKSDGVGRTYCYSINSDLIH